MEENKNLNPEPIKAEETAAPDDKAAKKAEKEAKKAAKKAERAEKKAAKPKKLKNEALLRRGGY